MQILPININSTTFNGRAVKAKIEPFVQNLRNESIDELRRSADLFDKPVSESQLIELCDNAKQLWQDMCDIMKKFHDKTVLTTCGQENDELKLRNSLLKTEIIITGEDSDCSWLRHKDVSYLAEMQEFWEPFKRADIYNPNKITELEEMLYRTALLRFELDAAKVDKRTLPKLKRQITNIMKYKKQCNIKDESNTRESLLNMVNECLNNNDIKAANKKLADSYKQLGLE